MNCFGLMQAIGLTTALMLLYILSKIRKIPYARAYWYFLAVVFLGFTFGNIGYHIVYLRDGYIFTWDGGQSVVCSLAGLVLISPFAARFAGSHFREALSILPPVFLAAQICGKIGCFLAGCCYGRACAAPWAVLLKPLDDSRRMSAYLMHPVQLYEVFGLTLGLALLLYAFSRKASGYLLGSLYLAVYGLTRFVAEFFRADSLHFVGPFSVSQVLAALLAAVGVLVLLKGIPDIQEKAS